VWNVIKNEKKNTIDMTPSTMLFGHRSPVVTLAASAAFAAFLSASGDGRVFMWDLNRLEFVRELDLGPAQKRNPIPVQAARINSVTGHIVLACGPRLIVTTLNGRLLMEQDVCVGDEDADGITAVAVYEGVGNEWCERELIFTGHRRGTVKVSTTTFLIFVIYFVLHTTASLTCPPIQTDLPPRSRPHWRLDHHAPQNPQPYRQQPRRWRKLCSTHHLYFAHAPKCVYRGRRWQSGTLFFFWFTAWGVV
jgi:hypothetical protein